MKLSFPKINLSIKLVIVLLVAVFFGNWLPESFKAAAYALSLSLKGLLLFVLPAIIFSCLFSCLLSFKGRQALGFMLTLFISVCVSNYVSTFVAYGVSYLNLLNLEAIALNPITAQHELVPLWDIHLPQWLPYDYALYLGLSFGAAFSFLQSPKAYQFSEWGKRYVTLFLEKVFIPTLPLFALGFILKMQHEGVLIQIIQSYIPLLLLITGTCLAYLLFLFAVAARFNRKRFLYFLKNILPVGVMGLSTMSSLATMPVTLTAAEKNTHNYDIPRMVIPATVNIHMIGISIAIPLMALSIVASYGYPFPSLTNYAIFALYFIMAQFSIAAVPGGGILVMLPLLEAHLGFSTEMSALITALYILFDPLVTLVNVLGNSAFVILISKLFKTANPSAEPVTI